MYKDRSIHRQWQPNLNQCTVAAKPKPVYVTQGRPQIVTNTGHSSGGIMLGVLTSGSSSGGGGGGSYSGGNGGGGIHTSIASNGGVDGAGGGGYYSSGSSGGMAEGSCPPIPHDCDPSCIKYDVPRCRRCLCENSLPQYGGSRYHG
ncbi:RNA-binding protein cabeza-like [Mizuhopecten yessoensis]|uniref:RNA-binding protein cabeza-like n=1 Tax=Mizuhopecten yessoensis TaxID=6573 RepID=UPI000B45D78E|nr:RNA-binding protein cabeza-like [Mizuhopecten yessoensis]